MSYKTKLFFILWLAGMAGVLSFLLVDLSALIATLPLPAGMAVPKITLTFKLLSLLQPGVLVALAALLGVALASKVGLSSPVAEAAASGSKLASACKPQIVPGVAGGLAGGVAIVLTAWIAKPLLPPDVTARIAGLGDVLPLPTRLLYGGFTEEILLRWGFMTLLVWAAWRLFQKRQGQPKPACFVGAILISSVVFAMGHLPIAFLLVPNPSFAFTAYVIVANSVFGLIAGFLYWKRGLEAAMLAHMLTHVVMFTAHYLGAYF
jgi:hypothetical protein